MLGLFYSGSDNEISQSEEAAKANFPLVSGEKGGNTVTEKYRNGASFAFPTVIVINPDKKIVENLGTYTEFNDNLMERLKKYNINATEIDGDNTYIYNNHFLSLLKPVNSGFFRFSVAKNSRYSLAVFGLDGKTIFTLPEEFHSAGSVWATWYDKTPGSGEYVLIVKSNNAVVLKEKFTNR